MEKFHEPLASRYKFYKRFFKGAGLGLLLIVLAEWVGMLGYHYLENMSWIDAYANAAMILSGMGPLEPIKTNAGKIFAGCYALFSGLMFILVIGIIFAPLLHRFLHKSYVRDES